MKISIVLGTRPEAIKLAPLILGIKKERDFKCHVCVTAQHRQMLDQVLSIFDITPDVDLDIMRPSQTLAGLSARAIEAVAGYLATEKPDIVIVQGDTTTVFCASLAAFYHGIPVGHVEAGLRTGNLKAPFPEEANRVLTSRLTALHFAPTETARRNLLNEGIPEIRIWVTGNTVIDALFLVLDKVRKSPCKIASLPEALQPDEDPVASKTTADRMVLITGHRRENFGSGFENICAAIARLAASFPDVHFVYPVHLNPRVQEPVRRTLHASNGRDGLQNVHLIEPLPYLPFVSLMERSTLILTDSGGVQEEAPSLGKPVLVMRETTERPEAVEAGTVRLVGTDQERIVEQVTELLTNRSAYDTMARAHNPYGDGKATGRIIAVLKQFRENRPTA